MHKIILLLTTLMIMAFALPVVRAHEDAPDYLVLARLCVEEAGWSITSDCSAINVVIQKRMVAQHTSFAAMARAYSPNNKRAWIEQLNLDAERPAAWPKTSSWNAHREKWVAMLEHAQQILNGERAAECNPDHWGAPYGQDLERARCSGWRELQCGDTRNKFWALTR